MAPKTSKNPSSSRDKGKKRARNNGGGSSRRTRDLAPEPDHRNDLTGRGGSEKSEVLFGMVLCFASLQHSIIARYARNHEYERFLSFHHEVYPKLAMWFYRHVKITVDEGFVCLACHFSGVNYYYTSEDFLEDFGLKCEGYSSCMFFTWPANERHYSDVALDINHGARNETGPNKGCLTGEERLILKVVREIIAPTNSNDNKISKHHSLLFLRIRDNEQLNIPVIIGAYMMRCMRDKTSSTLPYGMIVSKIMCKWGFLDKGQVSTRAVRPWIDRTNVLYQEGYFLDDRIITKREYKALPVEDKLRVEGVRKKIGELFPSDEEYEAPGLADQAGNVAVHDDEPSSSRPQSTQEQLREIRQRQDELRDEMRAGFQSIQKEQNSIKKAFSRLAKMLMCKNDDVVASQATIDLFRDSSGDES